MRAVAVSYPIRALFLLFPFLFLSWSGMQGGFEGPVPKPEEEAERPPFLEGSHEWADSVLQTLSLRERIGQLFMVAAYSERGAEHRRNLEKLVEGPEVGGLIFFQGGPARQAKMTERLQRESDVPLMVGIDGEWGLSMRLDSTLEYPRQMTLGALEDEGAIRRMGEQIGEQCRRLGVHINFAPVMDVNNNADNPVINERSFGEDPFKVAQKGIAYAKGLQEAGVLATAKHFPGHGDTDADSHHTLPRILHGRGRLDSVELFPFRKAVRRGVGGMMIAHLNVPALDPEPGSISTLSRPIVTELLRKEMGFEGLSFTDALNMKAVSDRYPPGELELKALEAGNDVLLFPENVPAAVDRIVRAVQNGRIDEERIAKSCEKILRFKEWAGLHERDTIETDSLRDDLHKAEYRAHIANSSASALTVLNDPDSTLPIQDLDQRIASVVIGNDTSNAFQRGLDRYARTDRYSLHKNASLNARNALIDRLRDYDLVILGVQGTTRNPASDFGISSRTLDVVQSIIGLRNRCVLDLFGNPYALSRLYGSQDADALIVSYEDRPLFHRLSADLIFGGRAAQGQLPVTASNYFQEGDGVKWSRSTRLSPGIPEEVGLDHRVLSRIDSIAREGIDIQAYPGCQILVARDRRVVHHKAYGHHTYEENREVKKSDIYDIASITKIAATTPSLMKLEDDGKLRMDRALCDYIPELVDTCSYQNVGVRDILTHRAGLRPWIPFYKKTLHHGRPDFRIYSTDSSAKYSVRVADDLYIDASYEDSIFSRILSADIEASQEYRYSDLGYYLLMQVIENQSGRTLDSYVKEKFYDPMGLRTMGYHPRKRFPLERIVPTEYDMYFRRQLIHGDVHDPGAAMLGGVGGHAGVFSNARDLGIMMQMFLDGGTYGGERYIQESTVKEYVECQFCGNDSIENRRGIGFDKPVRDDGPGPTCHCVSYESFGHSGFTGTIAWADPDEGIVYVFLSNRIHPTANNRKLLKEDIRPRIQQVIYDAIQDDDGIRADLSQE